MYDELMKKAAVYGTVLSVLMMCAMLFFIADRNEKGINIATTEHVSNTELVQEDAKELLFLPDTEKAAYLKIPLSTATTEDQILVESNYIEQKLYITISGLDTAFFEKNKIIADSTYTSRILYNYAEETARLEVQLTGIYEHTAFYKNNMLYLEFVTPDQMYDKLLVIDAGGSDDALTLAIVKKLKSKLDGTDIKVYYTRTDDSNPTEEKKVVLANLLRADMFISVQVVQDSVNPEANGMQTIYHPTFFIPELGSIDLADIMETQIVKSTGAKANGLLPAKGGELLIQEATVPAVIVQVGYVSHKDERELLREDEYQERIAAGIYNGILEAYKKLQQPEV